MKTADHNAPHFSPQRTCYEWMAGYQCQCCVQLLAQTVSRSFAGIFKPRIMLQDIRLCGCQKHYCIISLFD